MQRMKWTRLLAVLMALGLVAAACGSDADADADAGDASADDSGDTETTDEGSDADSAADGGGATGDELALEGQVEVAAGTVLDLDECPSDWDAMQGVDGDEIRVGQTLPQSGQLASFGEIGVGIEAYFDYVNATDPIDGKDLVLVTKDDGYEAGRAVANVEEMLDSEDIFFFAHLIGTPINVATRPITGEACVPQLFNSTGFPLWGDPVNWPWTIGNILNYATETDVWCADIVDNVGEGATVAALIMNNDFGKTYQQALEACAERGQIEIAELQLHDPAAPDVTNEMTTIASTDADVFVSATTAAFCPQTVASVAASEWRPRFYMSYTCNNLSSFFTPVLEQAGMLADEGSGVLMANSNKVCGDPQFDGDPAVEEIKEILNDYADGITCADGSFSTGVFYGQMVESLLRDTAELPGGLNRVNLMATMWNFDVENGMLLGGQLRSDGVNDAYLTEAAQIQQVVVEDGALTFAPQGDVSDFEAEGGSFEG